MAKPTHHNQHDMESTLAGQLSKKSQIATLVLAFALRMFVLFFVITNSSARWLYSRGVEVGYIATSVVTGHGFSSPFGGQTGPTALLAPGYPLFVSGVFKLFGISTNASAIVVMLIHIAVNLLTIWLMMHLAAKLFGARAAVIAGVFWACWLPLLWVPTIFWETSFSACIMVALLFFALRLREQPSRALWLTFGILCGIAVLINMALLITSLAIFVWILAQTWKANRANAALAALLFLLIYSVWPIRNERAFHAFVPLRTTVGLELLMGNHEGADGYQDESLFPMYNHRELTQYLREGEVTYNIRTSAQARAWIAMHHAEFVKLSAKRFFRYWTGSGMRKGSVLYWLGASITALFGLLGLYALVRSDRISLAILFATPMLFFPLPYYITHAEFRYRIVLDPLLTMLSAYAITQFTSKREGRDGVAPV